MGREARREIRRAALFYLPGADSSRWEVGEWKAARRDEPDGRSTADMARSRGLDAVALRGENERADQAVCLAITIERTFLYADSGSTFLLTSSVLDANGRALMMASA